MMADVGTSAEPTPTISPALVTMAEILSGDRNAHPAPCIAYQTA
jgi:hypothetical protein